MSNEITVKLECSIKEISNILEDMEFKIIKKYILNDTYFVPISLQLEKLNNREILFNKKVSEGAYDFENEYLEQKLGTISEKMSKLDDFIAKIPNKKCRKTLRKLIREKDTATYKYFERSQYLYYETGIDDGAYITKSIK